MTATWPAEPVGASPSPPPPAAAGPVPVLPIRPGIEIIVVLGVSLGISAISSWINFIDIQTRGGFRGATATLNGAESARAWVDLSYQLLDVVNGVMPAMLALYLLSRWPGGADFGIGLRLRDFAGLVRRDLPYGLGFAGLIGLPGLGLVVIARHLGINADISASGLADIWYRYPVLVLDGFQNGILEEVVMIGFLLTRLRELDWTPWKAVLLSAVIRGSYHTYQGIGGFVGNLIMGAIFGWWFTRTKRVLPLIIAHSVIDIVSFVGYAALHGRVGWI